MPGTGVVRTLFRPDSQHNVLFVTERCNSYCLMCSQPPRDVKDDWRIDLNLELIRLMEPCPQNIAITGGEPTLQADGLCAILLALRQRCPDTRVHMLTNGRRFSDISFTSRVASIGHPNFSVGVPLYGDVAADHDYVVQAHHAFDQTVLGLQQLARFSVPVEIRIVVHAATVRNLLAIAEFIYRNFPFAFHVAWMGLEPTGFAIANWQNLWVDPADYADELAGAVQFLSIRGMRVSIYNHPLCLLDRSVWQFSRKSISDWKNTYLEPCSNCTVKDACGGFFTSALTRHSQRISPVLPGPVHGCPV
jgi:His-Xaa-Ser system radical SAM maturase HxsC